MDKENAEYTTVYDYLLGYLYPCGHPYDDGEVCPECLYDRAIDQGEI